MSPNPGILFPRVVISFKMLLANETYETPLPIDAAKFCLHCLNIQARNIHFIAFVQVQGSGTNQIWVAEEIHPNSNICIIKNIQDGRCLRNMG